MRHVEVYWDVLAATTARKEKKTTEQVYRYLSTLKEDDLQEGRALQCLLSISSINAFTMNTEKQATNRYLIQK